MQTTLNTLHNSYFSKITKNYSRCPCQIYYTIEWLLTLENVSLCKLEKKQSSLSLLSVFQLNQQCPPSCACDLICKPYRKNTNDVECENVQINARYICRRGRAKSVFNTGATVTTEASTDSIPDNISCANKPLPRQLHYRHCSAHLHPDLSGSGGFNWSSSRMRKKLTNLS